MKKNGFLTFCCAMIPGCGQMYQGYMKRGLSLLLWFCSVIAVSVLTHIYILCILLPVIWAYSFFDAFNIRSLSMEQRAAFADGFVPTAMWQGSEEMRRWMEGDRGVKIVGWACVGFGVLILAGNLWDTMLYYLWRYVPVLAQIIERLPALLIAVIVIVLGLRILRGSRLFSDDKTGAAPAPRHTYPQGVPTEDEPMFTGAAPTAEAPAAPEAHWTTPAADTPVADETPKDALKEDDHE